MADPALDQIDTVRVRASGFAVAATHPERVSRWVVIDAPLPGVGPWDQIVQDPKRFDEGKRQHYAALYAQPGAMRASFAQFLPFSQDAADLVVDFLRRAR
jgi:pimeloyl-ACP methyl ester carboxylesterase